MVWRLELVHLLQLTPLRTVLSSSYSKCEGIWEVKMLQQNPPVFNWWCQLTQVVLYSGRKTEVAVAVATV